VLALGLPVPAHCLSMRFRQDMLAVMITGRRCVKDHSCEWRSYLTFSNGVDAPIVSLREQMILTRSCSPRSCPMEV
jgi:hypothetical protein